MDKRLKGFLAFMALFVLLAFGLPSILSNSQPQEALAAPTATRKVDISKITMPPTYTYKPMPTPDLSKLPTPAPTPTYASIYESDGSSDVDYDRAIKELEKALDEALKAEKCIGNDDLEWAGEHIACAQDHIMRALNALDY